jgi:hypothetical protein
MTEKIKEYKGGFILAATILVTIVLSVVFFIFTAPVINTF